MQHKGLCHKLPGKSWACRLQVQDTLAEIEERGEAVRELEKSLLDLHQIFLDMAVLVEAQGEMLDNIEAQVRHQDSSQSIQVSPSGGGRGRVCQVPSCSGAWFTPRQEASCTSDIALPLLCCFPSLRQYRP